jgi:hypothetical protein
MTWRVSLDSHGNGRIQSDDCDGDGIKITCVRDVHEFVQAIDVII